MAEHLPGCAALENIKVLSDKRRTDWVKFEMNVPGPCNCELGRLRAEVKRLEPFQQMCLAKDAVKTELRAEVTNLKDEKRDIIKNYEEALTELRARVKELEAKLNEAANALGREHEVLVVEIYELIAEARESG